MFEMLLILAAAAAAAAALAGLGYLLLWLLLHGRRNGPGWEKLDGFRYAHRGLHGCGVPENSLAAFRRAAEAGYGAELGRAPDKGRPSGGDPRCRAGPGCAASPAGQRS